MIARQHRFHGYSSLNFVYRRGSTVRNEHISLRFILNDRQTAFRAAVIVSRKVQKSAVVRNRIRRRLYEVIRTHQSDIVGPYDLVFSIFSDQVVDTPIGELTDQVEGLLKKAGAIANANQSVHPSHDIVKTQKDSL